ncbi:MAG TPA: hypothetical protein VMU93_02595 [Caulobacteraceae bacterium]|nr:hypothetical protein [Caulobacteraceae bacterium]
MRPGEADLFSQALFDFIERRAARTSNDEAFAIMHCEPQGDHHKRTTLFASAEALAEFEDAWREVRGLAASADPLAA